MRKTKKVMRRQLRSYDNKNSFTFGGHKAKNEIKI